MHYFLSRQLGSKPLGFARISVANSILCVLALKFER